MYWVCDVCDAAKYGKIMNRKELYELLVDEITEDLKGNSRDHEIVVACANQLNGLAKDNLVHDDYIITSLEGYGWEVLNLSQLQQNLENLKEYFSYRETKTEEDFNKIIEMIRKGGK